MRIKAPGDGPRPEAAGDAAALLQGLIRELSSVREGMLAQEAGAGAGLRGLHETYRESARNLIHYVVLRRHDLREAQHRLAELGLSSLEGAASHVMQNLEAVLRALGRLAGSDGPVNAPPGSGVGPSEAHKLLEAHTRTLLGPEPRRRRSRIMVTMPGKASDDYDLVRDLLARGMDCMRVNCAHDGPREWSGMIKNLRRAEKETGRRCRILMDLPGPKIRTGPVEPGPRVVSWNPALDEMGRPLSPARVWLAPADAGAAPPQQADARLPVAGRWLANTGEGDVVEFVDARGASGSLKIVESVGDGRWAESEGAAYLTPGTKLRLSGPAAGRRAAGEGAVGEVPPLEQSIRLRAGDLLTLRLDRRPGRPAEYDPEGGLVSPASIGVMMPEAFAHVRVGEAVWFDDGKIGGRVCRVGGGEVGVEITQAGPGGEKLKADKGINLPDSRLSLPPLTEGDLEVLPFVARNADLAGYSFVRSASGVRALLKRLAGLGGEGVGVVLKIETGRALLELPNLILAAMRGPSVGVMIARGDLAVECGYERLAELQEEVLWACEAAHVPVVWATQVLERLAKEGRPSRSEITDAAQGARAECVMLNKGDYILEAVGALDNILRRMQTHQRKKRSILRPLKMADHFAADGRPPNMPTVKKGKRRAGTGEGVN